MTTSNNTGLSNMTYSFINGQRIAAANRTGLLQRAPHIPIAVARYSFKRRVRRNGIKPRHRGYIRAGTDKPVTDPDKAKRFDAMVLPHLDAAYNLARWLARNDADAQDIAQEACLRAYKFFDGFHGNDGKSWLLAIVRNTCYTWLQKHRGRSREESFDENIHGDDPAFVDTLPHNNPEVLLMQQASKRIIDTALERLPVECREIIVLRELEDLSYKEIAEIAEIPIGTVMSRLSRARKLLREQLERQSADLQS